MWQSLQKLFVLLSPRQRRRALLLVLLLLVGALLEMVGVGLVPVYIGILAEPARLLQDPRVLEAMAFFGLGPEQVTQRTLLYGGSALLFATFTVKLVYAPLLAYVRARYIQSVVQEQSVRLFDAYLRAPYEFHLRRHSAELIRNINSECTRLGDTVLSPLVGMVSQLLITVAIVALLLIAAPGIALLTVLFFGLVIWPIVAVLSRRIKRLALAATDGRKRVIKNVQEALGGVKELGLLGRQPYFIARFRAALRQVLDLQRFLQVQTTGLPVFVEWVSVAALLVLVLVVLGGEQTGRNVLGVVALFAVAMARLKGSVTGLLGAYTQVKAGLVSVDTVDRDLRSLDALHRAATTKVADKREPALRLRDQIQIDDVWFRYDGGTDDALRGISLTVKRGEAIGFVGPSGGGKSTLVDVVLGVLSPQRGSIIVDGTAIAADPVAWHRAVGYIPQSIYLIDGTVRQNIALGLEAADIDEGALKRAATAASLDEFLASLPNGLDTVIGERGVRLSGGQRQRIAIARALYHDPDVLIMDEATAALDNITERAVMEAVEALKGQRTIIMIAHRLSTVRNCDRIVFLRDGETSGEGTYDQLVATHPEFARLARVV